MLHDRSEECGRDRQIVRRVLRFFQFFAQRLEGHRIRVVAVNITQQTAQFFESCGVESPVFLEAVFCPSPKLIHVPTSLCYTDDGYIEVATFNHGL